MQAEKPMGDEVPPLPFLARRPRIIKRADGCIYLFDDHPLVPSERSIAHLFVKRANEISDRILIAERDGTGWATVTYRDMLLRARRIAAALQAQGLQPGDRIMCLSGESIEHLALQLGGMLAGLVTVPISVRYSTAKDYARLDHVLRLIRPQLVFAEGAPLFQSALSHCAQRGAAILSGKDRGYNRIESAVDPIDTESALAEIGPETVYRILLTSGSTAAPKGVIQTHGMSCASLAFEASLKSGPVGLRPAEKELSWLPWSHVGGGITIINNILHSGASLYIDGGKPVPGSFNETVRNLRELPTKEFSSPPAGLTMLLPELEKDERFCAHFFSKLQYVKAGAAALPVTTWRRFEALALKTIGRTIPILSGYGMTETHGVMSLTWPCDKASGLGLPKPGVSLKLVPEDDRYEIRIKSDSVTPGYFESPEATAAAFDEEGFFCSGDMARFDPDYPELGLFFAGRLGENFKMATGAWVLGGQLRMELLDALDSLVSECLVIGDGQEELGLMIWGNVNDRANIQQRLEAFNLSAGGASRRIARLIFSDLPITEDRFERTEKGSLNRNRILAARQDEIDILFAANGYVPEHVVILSRQP